MGNKITVTILTKNSQEYIASCLHSLKDFDEIILLDNGSTDKTLNIAKDFTNVKIYKNDFIGFGPLKNLASSYAKNDWILSIDSDEIVSKDLSKEILNLKLQKNCVYSISRDNYYNEKLIHCCGWKNDTVYRLFNKSVTKFSNKQVHEKIIINNNIKIKKLKNKLQHYPYKNIEQLLEKMQKYSSLYAKENKFTKNSTPLKAFLRAFIAFIKNFFLQKGFLCGYEGLLISVCNTNGTFYKYMKLYEENKNITCSLIITTYNWPKALKLVLESVKMQTVLPNEVIVADDGSQNDTKQLINNISKDFPVPLIHSWQEDNGFRLAMSRNKAIALSRGEYVVIIDGDMILDKYFIEDHIKNSRKNRFIQGKRVLINEAKAKEALKTSKTIFSLFENGISNKHNAIHSNILSKLFSRKTNTLKGVKGCNFSLFKEDIIKINGFDNEFIGWGREDSEFLARFLNSAGERFDLRFNAIAYHIYHKENERKTLEKNDKILHDTIKFKRTKCQNGIDKFITTKEKNES